MTPNTRYAFPGPDNVTRVELDNGIVVLVYENHSVQSVYLTGSLHAGSIYENSEKTGLAAMTASALMHGTQRRDFDALHAELEDIGADLGFGAGVHRISFSGKALVEDLDVVVDILADTLRNPVFPPEHIERLRGERLTALHYYRQDTRWLTARAFQETLYPRHHAYHHDILGTMTTIPAIHQEDMRAFHQTHYGPRAMTIVIAGAIDTAKAILTVRQHLDGWTNPHQPAIAQLPDITSPTTTQRIMTAVSGKTQSDIMIGTLGPSRFAPDFQAANLANSILGQFGLMGRIGDVVREREGMAYYAGSYLEGGFGPGAWSISAGVDPANVERTIELCIQEIRRLVAEPVGAEDLADNQSYFTGHLPLQLESCQGIGLTLHLMESYRLGLDYLAKYHDIIYGLTREDLLAAAQRYLNPDALVITIAGPNHS